MIVIVVRGGIVQGVYSDEPEEDVVVLDFDNAASDPDSEVTPEQMEIELEQVARDMHAVL
ncbi:MAG: hypothetical protein ABFD92_07745 [Planctomycetaceae bacterium]|nr:hypothetical protein [Planctomycetaceae bacterium]